jgi:DNA-binding NtrC family response regulator
VIERAVSLGWSQTALSLRADAAPGSGQPASYGGRVPIDQPLKDARIAWTEQFEAVYVRALLERTGGNVTRAAELAGVNRRFLQRMMARLGIR